MTRDHCLAPIIEHTNLFSLLILHIKDHKGIARTQSPTNKNCAPESPTFGAIAAVSPTEVQWKGLVLGEPPNGSRYPLCQVSMLFQPTLPGFVSSIQSHQLSLAQHKVGLSGTKSSSLFYIHTSDGKSVPSPFKRRHSAYQDICVAISRQSSTL